MSTVKKGVLAHSKEWAKHLRRWGKRCFWKQNRKAEGREIKDQMA